MVETTVVAVQGTVEQVATAEAQTAVQEVHPTVTVPNAEAKVVASVAVTTRRQTEATVEAISASLPIKSM